MESNNTNTKNTLDYLIDPRFQGVNKFFFVLSLENKDGRIVQTKYYLPTVEIKDYNLRLMGKTSFISQLKMI